MTNTTTFAIHVLYTLVVRELETERKQYLDFCNEWRMNPLPVFEFLNRSQTYRDAMQAGFERLLWQEEETIITILKRIS